LLVSAIIEILFYYLQIDLSLGTILAVGLMFLLVMAIVKTGKDLLAAEKHKQEAIVAREAQAKFLANMSHEIRTPINAVIGMNEMILRENEDVTVEGYALNIQRASNMLLELVKLELL
jgi:signal transduction histidine kinase